MDQDGNTVQPNPCGFLLLGTLTGTATVTGDYNDLTAWAFDPSVNLPWAVDAYSPYPNPPGQPPAFLFGGPDLLDYAGLSISASARNYFASGYGRGSQFGDPAEPATGGISVHESIPLKLRLKWTPDYEGDDWYDGSGWYDEDGNPIDPPPAPPAPDHVDLLVTTSLGAAAGDGDGGSTASVTVSESKFGGSVTASGSDANRSPDVVGSHLLRVPVQGGFAEVEMDATGDAQASAPTAVGDGVGLSSASAYGDINAYANFDDREVAISSSLEPTYRKNPTTGQPEQNQRAGSGFMAADTVAPLPGQTIRVTYSPLYDRTQWGSSSQYHWQSNDYSPDQSGTFNGPIPFINQDVSSPYIDYTNPPTGPGGNDYITLTLTDGNDGAVASNNYSVLFHDYYEQWKRTATLDHPGAFKNPDGTLNPEWTRIVVVDNDTPASPSATLGTTYTDSVTETGQIAGQASLTAPGIAALQKNESISVGETCTGTISGTYQFPGAPWTKIVYYIAKTYEERWGTCDAYGTNGFQGNVNWYGVAATNPMLLSIHGEDEYDYDPH